jgi:2-oxoglutarate ferredoxin oxidoreductase subunit alpha
VSERTGRKTLVQGNVAIAEGAVQAGCKCYFGYPITPQNEIPEYLSARLPEVGGVFLQAESELASINMVLGAASTGARAMTSSSGPGISLMQEGISFTAGMQLPLVVVDVMRVGPGLGGIKPTQGDYFQATRGGGHGDYRTLVLAPGSVQEMFDLTALAFDLADKYRNPAIVFADAIIGQMKEPAYLELREPPKRVEKPWVLDGANGRPLRNIRSMYLEDDDQEELNLLLKEKYDRITQDEQRFDSYLTDDAECVVVGFGVAARIALSAVQMAREEGLPVGLFRPVTLFPYPTDALRSLSERVKRMLVVELNTGQMVDDVRATVLPDVTVGFHGRPGGGIPTPAEILAKIKEL